MHEIQELRYCLAVAQLDAPPQDVPLPPPEARGEAVPGAACRGRRLRHVTGFIL